MNSCAPLDLEIPPSGMEIGVPLNDLLERWVDDPQFLLEQVHIPDDGGVALAQGIIQCSARADGSYKP
jgi:ketosteroid isomerase-like protein